MELFNKSGIGLVSVIVLVGMVIAAQASDEMLPTPEQIEATALSARQNVESVSEGRISEWAARGLPVAERELAVLYRGRDGKRDEAIKLFEKAAEAGDAEAAFQLGEMYRIDVTGVKAEPSKAWAWYLEAAQRKHAKAALMLALLAKNGIGVVNNELEAAKWLTFASELGDSHATFLLYTAYQDGRGGVPRDAEKGMQLLVEAAQRQYPPAIRELASLGTSTRQTFLPSSPLNEGKILKEPGVQLQSWNRF